MLFLYFIFHKNQVKISFQSVNSFFVYDTFNLGTSVNFNNGNIFKFSIFKFVVRKGLKALDIHNDKW